MPRGRIRQQHGLRVNGEAMQTQVGTQKARLAVRGRDWYIVQVQAGTEERMCKRIQYESDVADRRQAEAAEEKLLAQLEAAQQAGDPMPSYLAEYAANGTSSDDVPHLLDECFSPRFCTQKKLRGEWINIEHSLMPGYLIAVTDDPWELQRRLHTLHAFARVVGMQTDPAGNSLTYVPLRPEERQWVEDHTQKGNRVIPMSMAYKEGDRIVVTDGPLVGQEGRIVRIKRSASLAFLEFHVGQISIKTTVGLGVITKPIG